MASKTEKAANIIQIAAQILGPVMLELLRVVRDLQAAQHAGGEITDEQWAQADVESEAAMDRLSAAIDAAREPNDADDVSP